MPQDEMRRKKNDALVHKGQLLDKAGIARALRSIAQKVVERHSDHTNIVLLGIRTAGVPLARRLQAHIREQTAIDVPCGVMDITLYRDDVFMGLPRPEVGPTELPCPIHGKSVILVDDVLFTGRTIRAALDELIEFGRPRCVQLAVLVDRGHRELPIQADFVGLSVQTACEETVRVMLEELGDSDQVALCEKTAS